MRKLIFLFSFALVTLSCITAQAQAPNFTDQLKLIIALGEADHFKSIQGDLLSTDADGSKTYSFPLNLDGFKTTMVLNTQGKIIVAMGESLEVSRSNIWALMDKTMRTISGLPGYTNSDYKAAHPKGLETFESVTELSKEGSAVKVQIYKMSNNIGYFLLIKA